MTAGPSPGADAEAPEPDGPLGVWALAWPSMTMFALNSLVGVVDFVFVSSLGTGAVAGVGVALQMQFVVFALLSAVTTGTVAVVARESGAGRWDEVGRSMRVAIVLGVTLGGSLMLAIPLADRIVAAMGVEPGVVELGATNLRTLLAFNVPFAIMIVLSMGLRGAGDVRTPLVVGAVTNAVNIGADWILIFGHWGAPALGAPGSALATGLAVTTSTGLYALLWARGWLVIPRGPFRDGVDHGRAWRQLRVGIPTAAEQTAFNVGLLLFLGIVARYGTEPVSAYLIGVRILSFCFVPGLGFMTAASTLVGQNLGAGAPRRAARSGWRACAYAMGVMGAVGLTIIVLARPLAGIFGAAGEATIDLAVTFIWILGAVQPLMGIEFALGGALRGAGDTRFPLFAILTGLFVFRLGLAIFVAGPLFGTVEAVWCCLLLDYGAKGTLLAWRFASGRWRQVRV